MAEGYQGRPFPELRRVLDRKNPRDDRIAELMGVHNGAQNLLRQRFQQRLDAIDADVNLSAVGKQRAKAGLLAELRRDDDFLRYQRRVVDTEKHVGTLRAKLTKREEPSTAGLTQAQLRFELERSRFLTGWDALPREEKQRAVRQWMDTKDLPKLKLVTSEPGTLSPEEASRVDALMMQVDADPALLDELTELVGPLDFRGEHDGARGALAVAKQSMQTLEDWLRSEGEVPKTLPELVAELNLPPEAVNVTDDSIQLSRVAAKDARIFRAASEQAQAQGLELRIEQQSDNGTA